MREERIGQKKNQRRISKKKNLLRMTIVLDRRNAGEWKKRMQKLK